MKTIRTKLLILMIVTTLSLAGLLTISSLHIQKTVNDEEVARALAAFAEEGAEKLALRNELVWSNLEMLCQEYRLCSMARAEKESFLQRQIEALGLYDIAIVDNEGMAIFASGQELNLAEDLTFQKALRGQRAVSNVFHFLESKAAVIAYAIAMKDEESQITSVLYALYPAEKMSEMVDHIRYGDEGSTFVISREGYFQSYPANPRFVLERIHLDDLVAEYPYLESFRSFVSESFAAEKGVGSYQTREKKVYRGYAPVRGTEWLLYTGSTEENVFEGFFRFRIIYYQLIFYLLLTGIIIAFVVASHFSKPVVQLEKAFLRAAEGDLAVRANVRGKDEIFRAANSFNLMMERVNELTYYDPITGLANQRVLAQKFSEKSLAGMEKSEGFILFLIAADGFSRINEKHGYDTGNELLRQAAQRLQLYLGSLGLLFRGQSDEFLVLCARDKLEIEPLQFARWFLRVMHEPYSLGGEKALLSFSVGIANFPEQADTLEELLRNAGFAKNMAKLEGAGRVKLYDSESRMRIMAGREMEEALAQALLNEELSILYQPIIDLKSEKIRGLEALLRWNSRDFGEVSPDVFIPLAERSGLILGIGRWVLETACRQYREWEKALPDMQLFLAVNISAKQFEYQDFLSDVRRIISNTGMKAEKLEFELTESYLISEVEESIKRLRHLQGMGIGISIDDFGTGFSSLSYLVRLPVDTLKVDRSFIMNLEENNQARTVASTIFAMGHSLKLKMIAEGIETELQLQIVKENNCQLGQGYYYYKPLAAEEIARLLKEQEH